MSALTAGLYRATVRGVADVILLADDAGDYATISKVSGWWGHEDVHITDARPLIVLDLHRFDIVDLLAIMRDAAVTSNKAWPSELLNRIVVQIEAQTKPARIPEPGLWGVVEASLPNHATISSWVHIRGSRWYTEHHGVAAWDVLVDPTLVREGVAS